MKKYQIELTDAFSNFIEEYSVAELFEILFPGQTIAEVFVDMYDNGMIPNDNIENFLED